MKKATVLLLCGALMCSNIFAQSLTLTGSTVISDWAESEVNEAIDLNLVDSNITSDYQKNITREEFCTLCCDTIRQWYNGDSEQQNADLSEIKEIKKLLENSENIQFEDTQSADVELCARLGIVSGMGDNKFEPERAITRQEAARMLYNTLDIMTPVINDYKNQNENGVNGIFLPHVFDDGADINNWARNEIYAMYHMGVMQGVGGNNYDPKGAYTREQAICTFLRLYYEYIEPKKNEKPEPEIYPNNEIVRSLYVNYRASDIYTLNAAYLWGTEGYEYKPVYTDGNGRGYTAEDKGYIYPTNKKYMEVLTSVGAGVSSCIIIDGSGKNVFGDRYFYSAEFLDDNHVLVRDIDTFNSHIYNLDTKQEAKADCDYIEYVGCGLYYFMQGENGGYMDIDGNVILKPEYKTLNATFMNNMGIVMKSEGSFQIVNTKGEVLKEFKVDTKKYNINGIYGTNMLLMENNSSDGKVHILRAGSGQYIKDYYFVGFTNNGEMYARKNGRNYILDINGNIKIDVAQKGYRNITEWYTCDFYTVNNNEYQNNPPMDVMDFNGNIIRKGLNIDTNMDMFIYDGGGIYMYKSSLSQITVFDKFGKDIGVIDVKGNIYDYKFINGLVYVASEDSENRYGRFYTPSGEPAIVNNWVIEKINKEE